MNRAQRRKTALGSRAAYRRIAIAGEIMFAGAFVFVTSCFAAMVYAWRKM